MFASSKMPSAPHEVPGAKGCQTA